MIGVIVVTYCSGDVILACLDSVIASSGAQLKIVVCDNDSPDDTVVRIRAWADGRGLDFRETSEPDECRPGAAVTLIRSSINVGFAGGVNRGLEFLMKDTACDLFWLLNPDCEVAPGAAAAFRRRADEVGDFALMGSRILYREEPGLIQSDGGQVGRWSGICRNLNQGADPAQTPHPEPADLDFISGASALASRKFVETVGLLEEDYFLYYEEVDWAARRGDLRLVLCDEALVHHHGGTAIGSGSVKRRASPFAIYFNYRNRMRYVARFRPVALPTAYLATLARVAKLATERAWVEAWAALLALHQLPPPRGVRDLLSPEAAELAFGRRGR